MSASSSYMTAEEFVNLAVDICKEIGYFKGDELLHPEDLAINITVVMQAIGATASHIMRKEAQRLPIYGHTHEDGV